VHTWLGQLDVAQPGRRFTVLDDPNDHSQLAIDHSQCGAADGIARQIASRHAGTDPATVAALLQQRIRDPNSVSAADLVAAIPGARVLGVGSTAAPSPGQDPVDPLTKLATQHDHGVVGDQEFAAQKARLLGEGQAGS